MSRLDLDLTVPAINLDAVTDPMPLDQQPVPHPGPDYVLDDTASIHPRGVWYKRADGHRILVGREPWKEPSKWALL